MKVLILGGGKIGSTIAKLLSHESEYEVSLASDNIEALKVPLKNYPVSLSDIDASDPDQFIPLLPAFHLVISALPYFFNTALATAALKAGISYFDLTEDRTTTQQIEQIAQKAVAGQIFMPQCGLAPGFIAILAHSLSHRFTTIRSIKMRVGALPLYPTNKLKYNLTWSTDGLINEYINPCEVIIGGKRREVLALEGMEHFTLDGIEYEAFNTSGGLGTLCTTLAGQVEEMSYKTVRYKGHRTLIDFLLNDLKLKKRRQELKTILEASTPISRQDVVLIFCSVSGMIDNSLEQVTYAKKLYHSTFLEEPVSAIELSTATSLCVAVDLFRQRKLPQKGLIRQEQIELDIFLSNRYGTLFNTAEPIEMMIEE